MKKKCKVVALATNDNKNFALVKRDFDWVVHEKDGSTDVKTWGHEMYHLYIISDDEIKVGDWYFSTEPYQSIEQATTKRLVKICNEETGKSIFKVIASTDPSLNLPAIPDWFIKEYAEKQTSEVMVDFLEMLCNGKIEDGVCIKCGVEDKQKFDNFCWELSGEKQLKLYPVKKTWTRDEIEFVLSHIYPEYNKTSGYDWVKQVMAKFDTVEQDMKADAYKQDFEDRNFYEGL